MALAGSVPGTPRDDGAAGPGIRVPRTAMPAVDPQMPSSFRQWALRQRPSFDARGNLATAARARAGRLHDAHLAASVLILPPNPVEPAPSDAAHPSPAVRHRFQDAQ